MLQLQQFTHLPPHNPSSSSIHNKQKKAIFLSGFNLSGDKELFGFKKSRRKISPNAVGKDSEFEVDPDKAREALRKLDDQLQSLSEKKPNPPKIRAVDIKQSDPREKEQSLEMFSGSFLTYVASGLLIFTIFYNIIFITVIKPSIDGL
ncbi:hypothetical protein CASFOL_035301 [Castilleja foliolosa]|uniref:Transmembrane protein n=1 Tax=Castilleja foliolosa TaxID=1961234 RepID=A0ABD3BT61_9LAMI